MQEVMGSMPKALQGLQAILWFFDAELGFVLQLRNRLRFNHGFYRK